MKFWYYDSFTFVLGFFLSFFLSFFFFGVSWWVPSGVMGTFGFISCNFVFDSISVYLIFLTIVLSLCIIFLSSWLESGTVFIIFLSQFFSLLCYTCCNALFFWVFYEASIVSLLYLLLKDSPYSERFSAFWYFTGYIVFSGLPMLLILLYFSSLNGSFSIVCWDVWECDYMYLLILSFLFMTKIPLFPFQVWLPIVHAESSSVVSICLSGYIMKLGVLGLFRFCSWVISDYLFFLVHVGFMILLSLFFFVCSSFELDVKRWLAFLSLAHISVVPLCLGVCAAEGFSVGFSYCLGHGLSTTFAFILFWFTSWIGGSRNWVIMCRVFWASWVWRFMVVVVFCVSASFPLSLQFFCELKVLGGSLVYSGFIFYVFCFYLFFGGLIPFVFLGLVFTRFNGVGFSWGGFSGPLVVLFFLFVLNFLCFLVF